MTLTPSTMYKAAERWQPLRLHNIGRTSQLGSQRLTIFNLTQLLQKSYLFTAATSYNSSISPSRLRNPAENRNLSPRADNRFSVDCSLCLTLVSRRPFQTLSFQTATKTRWRISVSSATFPNWGLITNAVDIATIHFLPAAMWRTTIPGQGTVADHMIMANITVASVTAAFFSVGPKRSPSEYCSVCPATRP